MRSHRPGFDPSVGKVPWGRAWQPIPVFSPGESPWTEEPGGLHVVHGVAKSQTQLSDYTQHSSANAALITTCTALGTFLASISPISEQE